MTRADQIYPLDKRIRRELDKAESDSFNKDVIIRYYKVRSSDMTKASILLYLVRLNQMSRLLGKRFEDSKIEDMEDLVFNITNLALAESTKNRMRKILKVFFRWLKKCQRGQFPPEVSWMTTKKSALITVKAEDLLSFEECVRISEHATNLRDRALIQCLLDAGCRIGEILTVEMGEVKFNDHGAILNSDGKTGEAPLILTWSAPTLAQWINVHPFRHMTEAPLFPKLEYSQPRQLSYQAARMAFKKCVKRAGYGERRIWFHLFKHVSCTYDSIRGMPQSYRNFKHHWSSDSEMNRVYEHLSSSVVPLIQLWGTNSSEAKPNDSGAADANKLTLECGRCEYKNPRDSHLCNKCGLILNDTKATELAIAKAKLEDMIKKLMEDPEKLKQFLSLLS
jgi:integrase/recombinase XerD